MGGLEERQVQDSEARNKKSCLCTVLPQIIAMGDFYYFTQKRSNYLREGNYAREVISSIAHWKACSNYIIF